MKLKAKFKADTREEILAQLEEFTAQFKAGVDEPKVPGTVSALTHGGGGGPP